MQTSELLALTRAAAGGDTWDDVPTLAIDGTIRAGGLCGPYRQLVALADGRFVTTYALGPATVAKGFDGRVAWQRGPNGEVIAQDADAARRAAMTEAFVNARGWWFAERWPAAFDAPVVHDEHHAVRVTPAGGQAVELWFERATHRLAHVVHNVAGKDFVRRFEDEREVHGLRLAHRIVTGSGDTRHDVVVEIDTVSTLHSLGDAAFAMPSQEFADVAFIDGSERATVDIELVSQHVYVPVTIGGTVLRLMLDTGGMNLLTPAAAARAGLAHVGALEGRGPGERSVEVGFARVERLAIGARVVLEDQLFRVMPLPGFDDVEGTAFDGLLGVELFQRLAVEIDYEGRRLTLARSPSFVAPAGATMLPLAFHAHLPAVQGTLDGLPGQFWLDTGNRNALTLWSPFVAAHGLAQRLAASAETTIGWGVGGRVAGRLARAGALALGELVIEAPTLTLPSAEDGPTATRHVAGNIGGDLLRRFVVSFDYARRVVHLAPNASVREPFTHDCAGLWINRRADGFVVESLLADGPAEAAGLQVGDCIVDVDGQAVAATTLDAVRRRLRDPAAGGRVRLRVVRAGVAFATELALRDPVPPAVGLTARAQSA